MEVWARFITSRFLSSSSRRRARTGQHCTSSCVPQSRQILVRQSFNWSNSGGELAKSAIIPRFLPLPCWAGFPCLPPPRCRGCCFSPGTWLHRRSATESTDSRLHTSPTRQRGSRSPSLTHRLVWCHRFYGSARAIAWARNSSEARKIVVIAIGVSLPLCTAARLACRPTGSAARPRKLR